jgi:hypothetical protein
MTTRQDTAATDGDEATDAALILRLDHAVSAFVVRLGGDDGEAVMRERTRVYEALLCCQLRAARRRGERQRAREGGDR